MRSEAAQRAGHTPHTGAPPSPPPGAGAGFMMGQPTPATCRAQRYGCLASRGTGSGLGGGGSLARGRGHPGPDCDLLCKHACPGTTPRPSLSTQAVSRGLLDLLGRIRSWPAPGEPPAPDSSQHEGPAHHTRGPKGLCSSTRPHCVQARGAPHQPDGCPPGLTVRSGEAPCAMVPGPPRAARLGGVGNAGRGS